MRATLAGCAAWAALALAAAPAPPAPIHLDGTLPRPLDPDSGLAAVWDDALASVETAARALIASAPAVRAGVPGTALVSADDARALQRALDCAAAHGQWIPDPLGDGLVTGGQGLLVHKHQPRHAACDKRFYHHHQQHHDDAGEAEWHVRPSLQWRWDPDPTCSPVDPTPPAIPSRTRFCTLLAHKSTLLVGDASTQYSLHDLLLDYAATRPQSCYGDLYCKEHPLCADLLLPGPPSVANPDVVWDLETARTDERVFADLPLPPGLSLTPPRAHSERAVRDRPAPGSTKKGGGRYPSATYGTLLRYRRTDGLRPAMAHTAPTYRHPATGTREINQPWLADARRSDLILLSKAPLPLPLRAVDPDFYAALENDDTAATRAEALVRLAAEWTRKVWAPELVEALRAIRAPPSPADQLVVYVSGWRQHPDCATRPSAPGDGPAPHPAPPSLEDLLGRTPEREGEGEGEGDVPLHIAWHNVQLVLQNHLARTVVLPRFGALYLDLETPLSVWPSGMVGAAASAGSGGSGSLVLQQEQEPGTGLRAPTSGDCTRYCFPSPGRALETHFLGALGRIMEAGWAGPHGEFEPDWVGDGYVKVRERADARADEK